MITLAATNTIVGSATASTTLTYTVTGDEISSSDSFKILAQGQLSTSATILYTVPSSTSTLIKTIILSNTTSSSATASFYINGTSTANQIFTLPIVGYGGATIDDTGLKVYDGNGNLQNIMPLPVGAATAANQTNGSMQTQVIPSATQTGLSVNFQSALSTTAVAVKTSAGRLYGYNFFNPGSSVAYVQIFNATTANITLGTTVPIMSIALPSNANASIGDDLMYAIPISFSTAISVAATSTPTGSTAPGAGLVTNIYYI